MKRITTLIMALMLCVAIFALGACEPSTTNTSVQGMEYNKAVTVDIVDQNLSLGAGDGSTFTAISNDVLSINSSGLVTPKGAGRAIVEQSNGDKILVVVTNIYSHYTAVSDEEDFARISNKLGDKYYLTKDIDFGGEAIDPITKAWDADGSVPFSGILDGRGYALKNFKIEENTMLEVSGGEQQGASLVPNLTGTIRNLSLVGANIKGDSFTGSFAGLSNGLIENCYFEGTIINNASFSKPGAGVVGIQGNGIIQNVFINASILGGYIVAGYAHGQIRNVYALRNTLPADLEIRGINSDPYAFNAIATSVKLIDDTELVDLANFEGFGNAWTIQTGSQPYLLRASATAPSWAVLD